MKIVADVPECIANQLDEPTALCNRYPRKVPLGEVAKLLGIDRASLEAMIIAQRCPFGMGWLRETATNRTFFISTVKLYTWYTEFVIKAMREDPKLIQ